MEVLDKKIDCLLDNNEELYSLLELSSELVFVLDKTGKFNFINKSGAENLSYNVEEIIEKHFFDFISEDFKIKVIEAFKELKSSASEVEFVVALIPKVGIEQTFSFKIKQLTEADELVGVFGIGKNTNEENIYKKKLKDFSSRLTESRRLNIIEKDRAKQKISVLNELNSLKNKFISNVSHELRTPLASIIGFSETVADDENLTLDNAKEFNQIILSESKRLAKFINDILNFSELESEKQKLSKNSVDVISILEKNVTSIKNLCEENNITLTSNLPDSEITIFADEKKLSKAINYLFANAIKFSEENGRIAIEAKEFLKEVEIIISDTGIGIPNEDLPHLFDKFSKIDNEESNLPGTGFSLITVKQIIDLHKGLIYIKSEVNKGTSFIIRLPKYLTD